MSGTARGEARDREQGKNDLHIASDATPSRKVPSDEGVVRHPTVRRTTPEERLRNEFVSVCNSQRRNNGNSENRHGFRGVILGRNACSTLALCAVVGVVASAAWSTTAAMWDSAPGAAPVLRTPTECTPSPTCDLSVAKTRYQQDVNADPSDKYGWYNLAVIAQSDKDSTTATRDYEKAIAVDPKFEPPLYNLGVMRFQTGNYTAAVGLLNRAVATNPRDANARLELASALVHLQQQPRPGPDP